MVSSIYTCISRWSLTDVVGFRSVCLFMLDSFGDLLIHVKSSGIIAG